VAKALCLEETSRCKARVLVKDIPYATVKAQVLETIARDGSIRREKVYALAGSFHLGQKYVARLIREKTVSAALMDMDKLLARGAPGGSWW
jgi:hypothetical protein